MTSGQVNQASGALLQVTTDCAQSTQSVATGDTSPLGQVPFISRAVTCKEPSGQLGQVAIAVGRPGWLTQPVAHEHEALFSADKWPANRETPDGGQRQNVDQPLAGNRHIGRSQDFA